MYIHLMPSEGFIYSSLSFFPSLVMQLMTLYSGWSEREMGFYGSIACNWGSWILICMLSVFLVGEIMDLAGFPWQTELCPFGGAVTWVKGDFSPNLLQCI